MHQLLICSYGIAAACFAILIEPFGNHPDYWDHHPVVAVLLALGVPSALGAAWISERRHLAENPRMCDRLIFLAPMPGAAGIISFLFLISVPVGAAFLVGMLALAGIMMRLR